MKYTMKTPCEACPFRNDITPFLSGEDRVRELEQHQDGEFPCHKTTELDEDDGETLLNPNGTVACAGRMIMSWNAYGGFGQLDAMAARLGMFDPETLNYDAPVFEDWDEMAEEMDAHRCHSAHKKL